MAKQELLFQAFKEAIGLASKDTTPLGFMRKLMDADFSKLELMIVDSAVKGMPLGNLYQTLILDKETYLNIVEHCTLKLLDVSDENDEDDVFVLEEHIENNKLTKNQ